MLVTRKLLMTTREFQVGDQITVNLKRHWRINFNSTKVTDEGTYFMFDKAVACRCINKSGKNKGGFKNSELYEWLNSEFRYLFPDELFERIKDISVPSIRTDVRSR